MVERDTWEFWASSFSRKVVNKQTLLTFPLDIHTYIYIHMHVRMHVRYLLHHHRKEIMLDQQSNMTGRDARDYSLLRPLTTPP